MSAGSRAFTLVELLVVITIIVVLLALLAPAMDRAIYQAELAVCGSRLKALGSSVTIYAMDHKRHYPYRPRANGGAANAIQHELAIVAPNNIPDDLRPRLRNYMSINDAMQCSFNKKADLVATHPDSNVFPSYQLWFGWQFKYPNTVVHPGMLKLGDRLGFEGNKFDVLASDVFANERATTQSSHPDYEGTYVNVVFQDEVVTGADVGGIATAGFRFAVSLWYGAGGTIDYQLVRGDGSVPRYPNVTFDAGGEHQMVYMPWRANGTQFPEKGTHLPLR